MDQRERKVLHVGPENEGERLDRFISESAGISRAQAQKLIERGNVGISGGPARKNRRVKEGERVSLELIAEVSDVLIPQDIPMDIVYMDDRVMVINKPPGLVMYPAAGHAKDTLMNAVAYHGKSLALIGGPLRPGVVHRLDKDTSGLVVIALTDEAYYSLQSQFKDRTIVRNYLAVIHGKMKNASGEIIAPIGRAVSDRKKMSVKTRTGKEAVTYYSVVEEFKKASLIQARLATGRTHQIRVHFASIGRPVLGDRTYGGKISVEFGGKIIKVPRQMLHAHTLGFVHPISGRQMLFTSPLMDDMEDILRILREDI